MLKYLIHHVDGLYFEILEDGGKNKNYRVVFFDSDKSIIYETNLSTRGWARLERKYLSDITIMVYNDKGLPIREIKVLDEIKHKKVFISFDSEALGDNIAWMPYCLEFKKKYNCRVIVSTFYNSFFESKYPELQFVPRGRTVNDLFAMFTIGWFWNKSKEPVHPATIPLQQSAANILNIPFEEIIPEIDFTPKDRPIEEKYIAISTQSTAQLKQWYYWQDVIDYLIADGYKVIEVSKEDCDFIGLTKINDKSMINTMNIIYHAEYFIGLSSGLSWVAWALKKHVVMIANFSEEGHEFTSNCTRITNTSVCHGCWNDTLFKFNMGDWNYCPENEDTQRHFECHKAIPAKNVIEKIKSLNLNN